MKELQSSFPRIERADRVYSQASVKDRVSQVYRQVILFGREATKYFLAHPLGTSTESEYLQRLTTFRQSDESDH